MTKLVDSLNKTATTENGALQYQSTGSCCLDFFTKVGSLRNHPDVAYRLFRHALIENRKVALMTLLWAYDCRGGAGERDVFKYIFTNALKDGLLKYGWAHILIMFLSMVVGICSSISFRMIASRTKSRFSGIF